MLSFMKKLISSLNNSKNGFDDSDKFLALAKEYKNDPLTLIYLINFLTKRYTLRRAKTLLFAGGLSEKWDCDLPGIKVLPVKIYKYELFMSGKVEVSNSINLKASSIIPWVWNKSRLIDCMRFIGTSKTPWKVDPCNHNVRFLFPMCYTIVYGGNHSLTTGILKQSDAEFETDYYYDLSELYKTIRYEGKYFYSQQGKFKLKPNEKITGVLFEIGRFILDSGFTYEDYVKQYKQSYNTQSSKLSNEFQQLDKELAELVNNSL